VREMLILFVTKESDWLSVQNLTYARLVFYSKPQIYARKRTKLIKNSQQHSRFWTEVLK